MTRNLNRGERVRLTREAFDSGVFPDTAANRKLRGTVASQPRSRWAVAVLWDGKKTVQRYWQGFLNRSRT